MLSHREIRQKFIDFFVKRGHLEIPSAPLLPEYDPTLLLTNSGMAPLKPYFLGLKKPPSHRLVNSQKCLRTGDIDEVGDIHHLTFFEMLGNWSIGKRNTHFSKEGIGPYFKKEACELALELLESFGFNKDRFYFGIFGGDKDLPGVSPDEETRSSWLNLGIKEERILALPLKDSFWFSGPIGPCGPNTDVLYDLGSEFACGKTTCGPTCDCGRFLEIWNAGVFMMYNRRGDGGLEELTLKSVDAGAGLERFALVLQKAKSVYETDLFLPLISQIKSLAQISGEPTNERSVRIIADHVRAASFLAGDGLLPSNVEAGYVLRRLIRRAITHGHLIGIEGYFVSELSELVVKNFQEAYPNLSQMHSLIHQILEDEEKRFGSVLKRGISQIEKIASSGSLRIDGPTAFRLFDSLGFPLDLMKEVAHSRGIEVDAEGFKENLTGQKERSKKAREVESYDPEKIRSAHTAAHLLNASLRKIFGSGVHQMGQKIGIKELRHDFNFDRKLTADEIKSLETLVNEVIGKNLPVASEETTFEKAKTEGAEALFEEKYRQVDRVTVYRIGPDPKTGEYFSSELCGGPHAASTGELKSFKIIKEEAAAAGIRRIRAKVDG